MAKTSGITALIATLHSDDNRNRSEAVDKLVEIGESAVPSLISALRNSDAKVRWEAAEALGRIQDVRAIDPLIETLADENATVRAISASSLGKIGDSRVVGPLIELLLKDREHSVLLLTLWALSSMKDERAIAPIIDLLESDLEIEIQAAMALAEFGPTAVEPLIAALGIGTYHKRTNVIFALGKFNDALAQRAIIAALSDDNLFVKAQAARQAGIQQILDAVPKLIDCLSDTRTLPTGARVYDFAAEALLKIGGQQAKIALTNWKQSKNTDDVSKRKTPRHLH